MHSFLRFQPYERTKLCISILLSHKNVIFQAQIPQYCVIWACFFAVIVYNKNVIIEHKNPIKSVKDCSDGTTYHE